MVGLKVEHRTIDKSIAFTRICRPMTILLSDCPGLFLNSMVDRLNELLDGSGGHLSVDIYRFTADINRYFCISVSGFDRFGNRVCTAFTSDRGDFKM